MNDNEIKKILLHYKRITIVGLSPDPSRPSHGVAQYLIEQKYDVVGVYPGQKNILGRHVYESIEQVPPPLEIVDVFRAPQHIHDLVDQLIPLQPKVLWLQEGVVHPLAEEKAREAGIQVISDRCIAKDHHRLILRDQKTA